MIEDRIRAALLETLESYGVFEEDVHLEIGRPKDPTHGDLSTNVALVLAKRLDRKPRELAGEIAASLDLGKDAVESLEIAGPGFINFRYAHGALVEPLLGILESGARFGESDAGGGQRINIEFISANPTGPLNIVSARAAAVGSALRRSMSLSGYRPHAEFYVNNAGRQVRLLGQSVRARYMELGGASDVQMPEEGYQGEYIVELARALREHGPQLPESLEKTSMGRFVGSLPTIEGVPEQWLELDEDESSTAFGNYALCVLLGQQRETCGRFGVSFDSWYLESELHENDRISAALERMRAGEHVYEEDGATWFRSTDYDDEKDRVLVRSDGTPTYFLADIAYHMTKLDRKAEVAIDFLGPDHHGHHARMLGAMETMDCPDGWLEIITLQQVNLIQDGKPLEMSKRAGRLVTMDELVDEVGSDVARFFFLARKNASHLDFDLDLAKAQSNDNPGWYVKYAHARICSVLRNAEAQGVSEEEVTLKELAKLTEDAEMALCRLLPELPRIIASSASSREMSRLTNFAIEVATAFHQFYQRCRILTDDAALSCARLALARATRTVLANTLDVLGMDAPERM